MDLRAVNLLVGKQISAWTHYFPEKRQIEGFSPGRPIFITGSHRSGTTWVAAMLAYPGVWYLHEPFNPNKGKWDEPFSYVPVKTSRSDVDRMLDRIQKGGARWALRGPHASSPLMPMRWAHVRYKQLMIKDPHACLMADYITRKLHTRTIALFRHPVGFVRSVMQLGWPSVLSLQAFLRCPELLDEQLSGQVDLVRKHAYDEGLESSAVLHACLCKVLWVATEMNPEIIPVRFEDLAMDPIHQFKLLVDKLNLSYSEEVQRWHIDMTQSKTQEPANQNPHEVKRNSSTMAWKWRREVKSSDVVRIREIWMRFDIPLYRHDTDWRHGD